MPLKRIESKDIAKVALTLGGLALAFGIGAYNLPDKKAPLVLTPVGDNVTASQDQVLVHVIGEVKQPGLYRLTPGARVNDAIKTAGGETKSADLQGVNLAEILKDGQQIQVPAREDFEPVEIQPFAALQGTISPAKQTTRPKNTKSTSTTKPSVKKAPTSTKASSAPKKPVKKGDDLRAGQISINYASLSELQKLPGIGPATASNIVGYRRENGPFFRVDDLINVRGIGPKKLAAIRRFIRL